MHTHTATQKKKKNKLLIVKIVQLHAWINDYMFFYFIFVGICCYFGRKRARVCVCVKMKSFVNGFLEILLSLDKKITFVF